MNFLPETLDTFTQDLIFESIGKRVLKMMDDKDNLFNSSFELKDPLTQLSKIFSCPDEKLPKDWEKVVENIIESLSPTDYAIHGKEICSGILKIRSNKNKCRNVNKEITAQFKNEEVVKNISPKDITEIIIHAYPEHRTEEIDALIENISIPKSPKLRINQTNNGNNEAYNCASKEFPQWLPTIDR